MSQTYMKHLTRIELIKDNVSNIVEIWECQFDELTKTDELMRQLVRDESDFKHPLKPRDALSGGRTNAIVLLYEGDSDYIDFTSHYPYVQKYGIFPIGHPEIITEYFDACIDNYFGLVFCRMCSLCAVIKTRKLLFRR
jgi:hypothetical protein